MRRERFRFLGRLYFQVLAGIALGVALGHLAPETGAAMKPLGDGFIKLIKMLIAPIVFATVVMGIAKVGEMKDVGRIGLKALVYFEILSTLALMLGLVVAKIFRPGAGMNVDPSTLNVQAVAAYASTARSLGMVEFLLNIIPTTIVDAFAKGEILQVLLFSVLFGLALLRSGEKGRSLVSLIDHIGHAFFGVVGIVMRLAPIGAFGAMAFTVGQYGLGAILSLGKLMASMYATCFMFVFIGLGGVARLAGFSLWKFLKYIKEEILIVLGTSSSESVLPRMMAKLEHVGCSRPVVGLVIPTGYSFNLDGTSIYMTMAAIFIAQATNTPLTIGQELGILGILLLTSKGAAAVTGGGFVTLAATLSIVPTLPIGGLALLLGVDRFMAEARSITNLIGNGVATMVVAKWDGALDTRRMTRILDGGTIEDADQPERLLVTEAHRASGQSAR